MRVFLAGASGVIGERLVPLLIDAGHTVAGMTRTPSKAGPLEALGAVPVVCDVFDRKALRKAVLDFDPELVVHQLTDLPDDRGQIPEFAERSRRMYIEGTPNLLARLRVPPALRAFWLRALPGSRPARPRTLCERTRRRSWRLAAS
jgi:nucleoside-diphosphate-sugar epimerase